MARIAGVLYLLIIIFGMCAQIFVRDHLVDYENATTTAKNILASEFLYRFGFVAELLMLICDVGVATILYLLLRDFNRSLNILSTFLRLVSIIILAGVALAHYASLYFLKENYLTSFDANQLAGMALLSIKLHGAGYNISLLFFGMHLIFLGYLFYWSKLIPRLLAILLVLAGICYIINSFTWFLFPSAVNTIYPTIMIPCFIGEFLLTLWFFIKGVRQNS